MEVILYFSIKYHFNYYIIFRIYDPLVEFRRQGVINNPLFRVFLNSYNFIPTYPHTLIVPTHITDEQLVDVVRFRSKGRIPAVTWYHKRTGCVLVRASQPLVGIIGILIFLFILYISNNFNEIINSKKMLSRWIYLQFVQAKRSQGRRCWSVFINKFLLPCRCKKFGCSWG